MEPYQLHILEWAGLLIEVRYSPDWLESYCVTYGYPLAHLEIKTVNREPLPVTETGYRSHFDRADNIEAEGGPVAYVLAWLDHAAQSQEWKQAVQKRQQLTLF
jgi:hypothetical protein